MQKELTITPDSKIGELLEAYPDLESTLLRLSPAFRHLKNPVLRRTVAKVASLRQVAAVGGVPLGVLINELRRSVGQEPAVESGAPEEEVDGPAPAWYGRCMIATQVDAGPLLERGEHPGKHVMKLLKEIPEDQCLELLTPFRPAPLIDLAREKGYESWTKRETGGGEEIYLTYFRRATGA